MELAPLVPAYGEQEGTLEVNTDISEASAIGIAKHLDRFFGYYHYECVTLKLNSPGGAVVGLEYILECMDGWRARGRNVHTLAMFRTSSAAALLMSLGEVGSRMAHRNSALLFHHARIGSAQYTLTSGAADKLATALKIVDQGMTQRLVAHCSKGFGGDGVMADVGAGRCQLLREQGPEIARDLCVSEPRRPLKWLTPVVRMWTDCQTRNSLVPYTKHLVTRFEEDSGMELREAWALGLLDRVKGVERLNLRSEKCEISTPVTPCAPSFRLSSQGKPQ